MDSNTNQQKQNDLVNQDPMYYKACKVACTLVEVTERFLGIINDVQQLLNNQNYNNINNSLKQLLEQYEHVGMIVNVLNSIYPVINNIQHQNSLAIAAKSAATTSLNSLSRVFDSVNASLQNVTIDPMTQQTLNAIQHQIIQSTAESNNDFGTPPVRMSPINDPMEIEKQELDIKRQQLEHEKEEFEKEKQMMLSSVQPPAVTVKTENNAIPEGLQEQLQIQNGIQGLVISSSQFLEKFEMTASEFAASSHMDVDSVWESMFAYALPGDKLPWAKQNILGRNLSWGEAKRIYLRQFPDITSTSPTPPRSRPISPLPASPSAAVAIPKQPAGHSKLSKLPSISNAKIDLRRVARYAEHLLSLEMKVNDNIDEYNARYLRYSRCAQMDLNDASLIRRYCNSLLPHYRNLLMEHLKMSPVNNLEAVISLASSLAKANPATAKYTQNCIHNRNMLKAIPANQDTTYHHHENDVGAGKGQKRELMGSPPSSSLKTKRPTVF